MTVDISWEATLLFAITFVLTKLSRKDCLQTFLMTQIQECITSNVFE